LPARQDARVHRELHPRGRQGGVLRVLHGRLRRRPVRALARRERRLRAAQPRLGPVVQRVQRDHVPQRDDLLRPLAAGARPRALPREPRPLRRARARAQGDDRLQPVRGLVRGARPRRADLQEGAMSRDLIVIGASWGGLDALRRLLASVPDELDVLFESAADAYGEGVIGVVLTGSNDDGAAGLRLIVARGGVAIVQDPDTAERRELPDAALAAVPQAAVLALDEIGPYLATVCFAGSGA